MSSSGSNWLYILSKKDDCSISVNDLLPAAKKLNFFRKGISTEPEALSKLTFRFPFISLKLPTLPVRSITLDSLPPYFEGNAPLYKSTLLIAFALNALKKPKK